MNQTEQMREVLREIHEEARDRYRNKDGVSPMWILERTQFALHAAEPTKLVRLTDEEIEAVCDAYGITKVMLAKGFANAIMNELEAKNGRKV